MFLSPLARTVGQPGYDLPAAVETSAAGMPERTSDSRAKTPAAAPTRAIDPGGSYSALAAFSTQRVRPLMMSTGRGKTTVVFFSEPISTSVCR